MDECPMRPIGYLKSVFHFKNGTPRQSSLCKSARGILTIEKSVFTNPQHSLEGLEEYSHIWILFVFHKNNNAHFKAKVKPPRLNGRRVGVFASRSPYRPNNVGLSLVKIEHIEGSSIYVSGIDMLDGTPVLDIKPYIPEYDAPKPSTLTESAEMENEIICSQTLKDGSVDNMKPTDQSGGPSPCFDISKNSVTSHKHENVLDSDSDMNYKICDTHSEPKDSVIESDTGSSENNDCLTHTDVESGVIHTEHQQEESLAEGFYTMSVALHKAEQKLKKPNSVEENDFDSQSLHKLRNKLKVKSGHSDDRSGKHEQCIESKADEYLSDLVDQIMSQAVVDVQNITNGCEENEINTMSTDVDSVTLTSSNKQFNTVKDSFQNTTVQPLDKSIGKQSTNTSPIIALKTQDLNNAAVISSDTLKDKSSSSAVVAPWLHQPPTPQLDVSFTTEALHQLQQFSPKSSNPEYCLQMFEGPDEAQTSICDILREDPRSVYRKTHCEDSLYFFAVDVLHVTCWFDTVTSAQVIRVQPVCRASKLKTDENGHRI